MSQVFHFDNTLLNFLADKWLYSLLLYGLIYWLKVEVIDVIRSKNRTKNIKGDKTINHNTVIKDLSYNSKNNKDN